MLDGVISTDAAQAARLEFRELFNNYGKALESDTHAARWRSDYCQTLTEHQARVLGFPALASAIKVLKAIGHELAQLHDASSLSVAPSAQLAIYPGQGTRYRRHGDNLYAPAEAQTQPSGFNNWRVWTVILYVNRGWVPADGGCLRIYGHCAGAEAPLPASTLREESSFVDVEPIAGRVLAFNSLLHHEVLPVDGLRCALTLWCWREDGNLDKFPLS